MKDKNLIEYAIVDHLHLMVKNLFKSLSKNDKESRLHIKQDYANCQIEVRGFAQLDGFDLLLLQTVTGMAGANKKIIDAETNGETGKQLRQKLDLQHSSIFEKCLVIESSYRNLALQMGRSYGGSFTKKVQESIKNISTTNFFIESNNGNLFGFNLISSVNATNNTFAVALNPFLASAIMSERNFTKILLTESRQLKTDAGRILHSRLSAYMQIGSEKMFKIETLMSFIWEDSISKATTRKRKERLIKKIFPDLRKIGWKVQELENDIVRIRRQKPPNTQKQEIDLSLVD